MKPVQKPSLSPETKERIKHGFYIIHNRQLHLKDLKLMRLADARRYIDIARRAESLAQPIEGIGQKRRLGKIVKITLVCIVLLVAVAGAVVMYKRQFVEHQTVEQQPKSPLELTGP